MLTEIALMCTKERCIRISFMVLNTFFSAFGVALFTGSSIVCYDHSMADNYLGYSSFQKALENANVNVHTPSSLNIGETLDVFCNVIIVIGVLFLLLGILGIIGAIVRLKALLITYDLVLLLLVVLELICVILVTTRIGKLEGWIKDVLKDSIRNNYTGITGNDTDTLRWNFIMHSFQCCGVDRYTDFRTLPARIWNTEIDIGGTVVGKQIQYACCKVKNDTTCLLRPNNTTAFIEKGCYQVMRNWVKQNTAVILGVGVIILVTELILVVLALVIYCTSRKKTHGNVDDINLVPPVELPQPNLAPRNQNIFYPSDVISNPAYVDPTWYNTSIEMYPLRQPRELFNNYNQPPGVYDMISDDHDTYTLGLRHN